MNNRPSKNADLATALKMLRMRSGKSLKELTDEVGVTQQAMSRWENATATFPEERIPRYLKAIGKTAEDLTREMAMLAEDGAAYQSQSQSSASAMSTPTGGLEILSVKDESMSPWCEPGERVYFRRGELPKRYEGCVVEMRDGSKMIRRYERERDGFYFFQRINPESTESILHSEVLSIHRIEFRG